MARLFEPQDLGFAPSVVSTWDPTLYRDLRVLVPIHLDALVARTAGGTVADCRMRTPDEGGSTRSVDLLPDPFADKAETRARGVYLHWAMPDGLADVRPAGSTASVPALPDRWLVVRIGATVARARAVSAWVLDSRTGAVPVPLDRWTAAAPTGNPVTVLGIGDAGWSVYYDNVVNRFAFYDGLDGVTSGPLAYLVCGWYADAAADPLAVSLSSLAAFEAQLTALGWQLSQADLDRAERESTRRLETVTLSGLENPHGVRRMAGEVFMKREASPLAMSGKPLDTVYAIAQTHWPRSSLFHGSVVGIPWPTLTSNSPEVGGPPSPAGIEVALGATPTDALAAIVGGATGTAADGEWLTAFALGALEELTQPDGAIRIDDRLHEASFASKSDGFERVPRPPSDFPERAPTPPPRPPVKGVKDVRAEAADTVSRVTDGAAKSDLTSVASGEKWALARDLSPGAAWTVKEAAFHEVHVKPGRAKLPTLTEITLPRPRLYLPADPVIAIQGASRSPKHGGDGRYSSDQRLLCRLTGSTVTVMSCRASSRGTRAVVRGIDVLARPLAHGGIPPECEELLEELGLLDPGSAPVIAERMTSGRAVEAPLPAGTVERTVATEQTAWWALRSPDVDANVLLARSGIGGMLPSPIAVRPSQRPWVPLHLDWEIEYLPTPAAAWSPGEIDFAPPAVPDTDGERFRGRVLLSAGVTTALARSLRKYVAEERARGGSVLGDAGREAALSDLATQLETIDVLAGPLEHLHLKLRRDVAPDAPAVTSAPPGFVAVRAGFMRIVKLRLIDAFGQIVYLAGSGPGADDDVEPELVVVGTGIDVPGAQGILALPPRFTAASKLSFRFRDAGQTTTDATSERSPVCGWMLPDHIDRALEFFDADGNAVGQLRYDIDHGNLWELAPGLPTAVGASPREAIVHPEVGLMSEELLAIGTADAAAGRTPALLELLRVIDSTRWTVDPFAHVGEEHLALLVGHPIAIVASTVRIEVREPVAGTDVPVTRVPLRLGALSHWQDGLFGYFISGDYRVFHCAAAAAAFARPGGPDGFLGPIDTVPTYAAQFADDVSGDSGATPVTHPYIDASGVVWVVPGVEYPLLLLVEAHAVVHATTCLLPRKLLGVQREWMAPALARMAPTFRFGPVLRDPQQIRMPIPADIGAAWTWTHRADVDRWAEEDVVHAGHEALLPPDPAVANEGWLKLTPKEPEGGDGGSSGSS